MNEHRNSLGNSSIKSNLSEKAQSLSKEEIGLKYEKMKAPTQIPAHPSGKRKGKKKPVGFLGRLFGCCNESPEETKPYDPSRKKYSNSLLGSTHKTAYTIDPNKFSNYQTSESTAKTADEFAIANKSFSKSLYSVENNTKEKGEEESVQTFNKKGKWRIKKNISEEILSPLFLEKYKKNSMFFLFSESGKEFVLAKITEKKYLLNKSKAITSKSMLVKEPPTQENKSFFCNLFKEKTCNQKFYDIGVNLFSLYDKNIKLDFESWCTVTPEKVAKDIAKRMKKFDVIVDAFCGAGGNLIQFAKECNLVIGIDLNETKVAYAKHNSNIYGVTDKIEFICADFLKLNCRGWTADLVFLNPSWKKPEPGEKFSLFTHIVPDIRKTMIQAFRISTNIALLLPKYCEISELATLFFEANHELKRLSKRSIEIECIYINENFERVAVYFGDCHQMTKGDERNFLINYINQDNFRDIFHQESAPFLNYIIEKLGFHRLCEQILETEKEDLTNHRKTLFQQLIDKFQNKKLLSEEEVEKFMKPQKDLNGDVIGYFSNSLTDSLQETLIRNISLTSEIASNYDKEMVSPDKKEKSPKKLEKEKSEDIVNEINSFKNPKESRNKLYTYKESDLGYTQSDEDLIYDDTFTPRDYITSESISKCGSSSQKQLFISKNIMESIPSNNEQSRKLREQPKDMSLESKRIKNSSIENDINCLK